MSVTSNPLYASQWHFNLIGNIDEIWAEYSGAGVDVAVFDDGTQAIHPDLDDNYDFGISYNGPGSDNSGQPDLFSGENFHGTAVAGIIAAENNNIGGVGVSWGANIVGVNYLDELQDQGFGSQALREMEDYDVVNNSWGTTPDYFSYNDIFDFFSSAADDYDAVTSSVASGRSGLGTIVVKASGNDNGDSVLESDGILGSAQGEGLNSAHSLISVAATNRYGDVEFYSTYGANIMISAPAAAVTTDIVGSNGYRFNDYTFDFGGTSAAAPVVSGVAALMLEANPSLGWRDVYNILALSASHTGSDFGSGPIGYEEGAWFANAATNWNGGGVTFNYSYGFGMVDAFAAVRMAEVWGTLYGTAQTSANELTVNASMSGGNLVVSNNSTAERTITVTEDIQIEHLYVTIDASHGRPSDLTVEIISPEGTVFTLFEKEGNRDTPITTDFTFGIRGLRETTSAGDWTIRVTDDRVNFIGTIRDVDLQFHGKEISTDTVHHITNDYFTQLASAETARQTLQDLDGGTDWLNLVGLSNDVSLSLASGGTLAMSGQTVTGTFQDGAQFENIALGDGADLATGSTETNHIMGGRGNDGLAGGGGTDLLEGGIGNDILTGDGNAVADVALAQTVYRLYQATLDRLPDAAGVAGWTKILADGQTLANVVGGFTNSSEFQTRYGTTTNEQFVTLLYNNVLERAPDAAGLSGWVSQLTSAAMTREEVVLGFSESREFRTNTAVDSITYTVGDFAASWTDDVFRLYQATLDRIPDYPGMLGWMNSLGNGTEYLSVVSAFIGSTEFTSTYGATNNTQFVTQLYNNVLDRAPDTAGLNGWVDRLESGELDRAGVVKGFAQSVEFIMETEAEVIGFMQAQDFDDTLSGGVGNNVLYGGAGRDMFVFDFAEYAGQNVADFEIWDVIQVDGHSFGSPIDGSFAYEDLVEHIVETDAGLVYDEGDFYFILQGVELDDLTEDNFVFL